MLKSSVSCFSQNKTKSFPSIIKTKKAKLSLRHEHQGLSILRRCKAIAGMNGVIFQRARSLVEEYWFPIPGVAGSTPVGRTINMA